MMQYKDYTGVLEVDDEAGILHGRVIGTRDVITFQGQTVADARQAFEDSVDDYLEFCAARGEPPEKPFSGRFVVRLDPSLHRDLAREAEARSVSLNTLVGSSLEEQLAWERDSAIEAAVAASVRLARKIAREIETTGITPETKELMDRVRHLDEFVKTQSGEGAARPARPSSRRFVGTPKRPKTPSRSRK